MEAQDGAACRNMHADCDATICWIVFDARYVLARDAPVVELAPLAGMAYILGAPLAPAKSSIQKN